MTLEEVYRHGTPRAPTVRPKTAAGRRRIDAGRGHSSGEAWMPRLWHSEGRMVWTWGAGSAATSRDGVATRVGMCESAACQS